VSVRLYVCVIGNTDEDTFFRCIFVGCDRIYQRNSPMLPLVMKALQGTKGHRHHTDGSSGNFSPRRVWRARTAEPLAEWTKVFVSVRRCL